VNPLARTDLPLGTQGALRAAHTGAAGVQHDLNGTVQSQFWPLLKSWFS
jgi:hypothetical protein